jgi:hypothetical protein
MINSEKYSSDDNYGAFGMKLKTKGDRINDQNEDNTDISKMAVYEVGMSATEYAELLEEDRYE